MSAASFEAKDPSPKGTQTPSAKPRGGYHYAGSALPIIHDPHYSLRNYTIEVLATNTTKAHYSAMKISTKDHTAPIRSVNLGKAMVFFAMLNATCSAHSSTWVESLTLSFDTPLSTEVGGDLPRQQLLRISAGSLPQRISIEIPTSIGIKAFTINEQGIFFVPDAAFEKNGFVFTSRDIVHRAPDGALTISWSGDQLGLSDNVEIDALSSVAMGFLLSLGSSDSIDGQIVTQNDLLMWDGQSLTRLVSSADIGIESTSNLIALDTLPGSKYLLGFDAPGTISGANYLAGDLVELDSSSMHASVFRRRDSFGVVCAPCILTGVSTTGSLDIMMRDGFESH